MPLSKACMACWAAPGLPPSAAASSPAASQNAFNRSIYDHGTGVLEYITVGLTTYNLWGYLGF